MLWKIIKQTIYWLIKLIIPPPQTEPDETINENEKCPACGHRSGELRTIQDAKQTILVQHRCKICGARWHENTILAAKPGIIIPAQLWMQSEEIHPS